MRLTELAGVGARRDAAMAGLRAWLATLGPARVGVDFPFSVPAAVAANEPWTSWLANLPRRHGDAEGFRSHCLNAAGGRELRRACDVAAATPMSPYNLRVYRQTWHGLTAVLAPLVEAGAIRVPPMQSIDNARPAVFEVCPASTLKRLDLYLPRYKGRGPLPRQARRRILKGLGQCCGMARSAAQAALEDPGGDALDAIVACLAAAQAELDLNVPREGWVYG